MATVTPQARRKVARQRASLLRRGTADRIANKLHAALWVIGAVLTLVYTEVIDVVLEHPQVDRFVCRIGF